MSSKNGFVFAPKGKGKDNDLNPQKTVEPEKKKGFMVDMGNMSQKVSEFKQNREANKEKAAEAQLKQARRDYEVAATKAGVQEEKTKVVEEQLKAKQQEQNAKAAEEQMKNAGVQEKQQKEETFWDVKNRIHRSKPENTF
jgi:hypothetical protein